MAGEGEHPAHLQAGLLRRLGHTGRIGRRHATAGQAAVDLDHDPHPPGQGRQPLGGRGGVGAHRDLDLAGQVSQPADEVPGRPQRVGDEDVRHPGPGLPGLRGADHGRCLADGRDGQAPGAQGHLPAGDLPALVRLGVRPQRYPRIRRERRHDCQVALQPVREHHRGRGSQAAGQESAGHHGPHHDPQAGTGAAARLAGGQVLRRR